MARNPEGRHPAQQPDMACVVCVRYGPVDTEVRLLLKRMAESLSHGVGGPSEVPLAQDADTIASILGLEDDEEFVEASYERILGRSPDPHGRVAQLARLARGETRADVVRLMLLSPEAIGSRVRSGEGALTWDLPYHLEAVALGARLPVHVGHMAFVMAAYGTILGRDPDPTGFLHYYRELLGGVARAEVVGRLLGSSEAHDAGTSMASTPELIQRIADTAQVLGTLVLTARKLDWLAFGARRSHDMLERFGERLDELEARQVETMALLRETASELSAEIVPTT